MPNRPERFAKEAKHISWGYLFGGLGAMLFSLKAVLIKLAYQPGEGLATNELDTITLVALRLAFAMPVYLLIGFWAYREKRQQNMPMPSKAAFLQAAGLGVLGYYVCSYVDFYGLKFITAQLERLLLFTYPVFVFILSALFFGGRFTLSGAASIVLAYAGIGLIFGGGEIATGENVLLGSCLVLACALLFSFFQLWAKPLIDQMGSRLFTCTAMIAAGLMALSHFVVGNGVAGSLDTALLLPPRIYFLVLLLAFFSTVLPSFLINAALGRIGAPAVAALGLLGPVSTIGAAILILGEPFGLVDGAGTLLVLIGIGLYTWLDQRQKKKNTA